jgi:restriction endonuclease Mrr
VVTANDFLTFDAKLDKLLNWKRGLSNDMLNGTGDVLPSEFSDLGAPDGETAFGTEIFAVSDLDAVDPDAFEALCALLWSKAGYRNIKRTRKSGDGGVDVVAISGNEGVLIQCKSSTVDGIELGWEAVKDVVAGAAAYSAKHPNVSFSLIAATNKRFNGTARAQASANGVTLYEGAALATMLSDTPIKRSELRR